LDCPAWAATSSADSPAGGLPLSAAGSPPVILLSSSSEPMLSELERREIYRCRP
jgi:hypothetical protein